MLERSERGNLNHQAPSLRSPEGDGERRRAEERRDTSGSCFGGDGWGQINERCRSRTTGEQLEVLRGSAAQVNVADPSFTWFFPAMRQLRWKNLLRNGAVAPSKAQYILLISNILWGK